MPHASGTNLYTVHAPTDGLQDQNTHSYAQDPKLGPCLPHVQMSMPYMHVVVHTCSLQPGHEQVASCSLLITSAAQHAWHACCNLWALKPGTPLGLRF